MRRIETPTPSTEKKQAAFLALVTHCQVWQFYDGDDQQMRQMKVPLVLMVNRWDGNIGFPGGYFDPEQVDPLGAVVIKLNEEIGARIDPDIITPLCCHESETVATHLFTAHVSEAQMAAIQQKIFQTRDYRPEITGTFLAHLAIYPKGNGFPRLLRSSLISAVRQELVILASHGNYLTPEQLKEACQEAGYDLAQLLG